MDAGSKHSSAAKGSAIDLEEAGSGLVGCWLHVHNDFYTYVTPPVQVAVGDDHHECRWSI